jgi:MFS family permease
MATITDVDAALSPNEHDRELRRAIVAATVGTTIEWYDFLLYSTMAGLVFGKLFFPNEDPLTATLNAFGIYFVGFIARPVGALWRPHWSQVGAYRHTDADGQFDVPGGVSVGLRPDRRVGCGNANHSARIARHRRGRRVGRLSSALKRDLLLTAVLCATLLSAVTIPLSGHISDRIGRKKMYMIGSATMGIFGFIYFGLIDHSLAGPDLRRNRRLAHPARHAIWTAGGTHRRELHASTAV